ncbi:hypothetical protein ACFXTH_035872 [Malus domestica]
MLCKMVLVPRKKKIGKVPVYLNVYDLTPINGYAYWLGLGVYHSGVQVHGVEYAFGAHDHATTGIFEVEPKQCPSFVFRKSILIGRTDLDPKEVRAFMEKLTEEYSGNPYHLITKNCNHGAVQQGCPEASAERPALHPSSSIGQPCMVSTRSDSVA